MATAVIVAAVGFHIWGLTKYFPSGALNPSEPFYNKSYALHYALALREARALLNHGRLWSYSPALMAGYPSGTRTEPTGFLAALILASSNGFLPPALSYKILVLALYGAAPLALALAALWFGLSFEAAALAAVLGEIGFFSSPTLAMVHAGMFAFASASYLAPAASAAMYRFVKLGGRGRAVGTAVGLGLFSYLHPLVPLLLVGPVLGLLGSAITERRRVSALIGILVFASVLAIPWVGPLILTNDYGLPFANWWQTQTTVIEALRQLFVLRLNLPPILLVGLALYGVAIAPLDRALRMGLALTLTAFTGIAYLGSAVPGLQLVEPGRFEVPMFFFGAPFAAAGGLAWYRHLGRLRPSLKLPLRAIGYLGLVFTFALALAVIKFDLGWQGPIASTLPPDALRIRGWIAHHDPSSRIIVETGYWEEGPRLWLPYFDADVGPLWAFTTGRELIGGSPSEGFSVFRFASFSNHEAFGLPLDKMTPEVLAADLRAYNVGAAITWSEKAGRLIYSIPGVELKDVVGHYLLYKIPGPHSFLAEGHAASVQAVDDCIVLRQAAAGRLVLRYHYFPTLQATPNLPLRPVPAGNGDPVPFIAIENDSPRDIEIVNTGFLNLAEPRCSTKNPALDR